ncbi:hypothetical protein RvY_10723 [Ramazzottius varieornatus]|uniref:Uncharacterized protein n=1 Tax=Ramazzottius varieornatus TaxID=947166 RepID=A0A1D1VDP0_RAMVA|nr:hypothetical protein RvY_10723 [Ramazzottius varieornatus]
MEKEQSQYASVLGTTTSAVPKIKVEQGSPAKIDSQKDPPNTTTSSRPSSDMEENAGEVPPPAGTPSAYASTTKVKYEGIDLTGPDQPCANCDSSCAAHAVSSPSENVESEPINASHYSAASQSAVDGHSKRQESFKDALKKNHTGQPATTDSSSTPTLPPEDDQRGRSPRTASNVPFILKTYKIPKKQQLNDALTSVSTTIANETSNVVGRADDPGILHQPDATQQRLATLAAVHEKKTSGDFETQTSTGLFGTDVSASGRAGSLPKKKPPPETASGTNQAKTTPNTMSPIPRLPAVQPDIAGSRKNGNADNPRSSESNECSTAPSPRRHEQKADSHWKVAGKRLNEGTKVTKDNPRAKSQTAKEPTVSPSVVTSHQTVVNTTVSDRVTRNGTTGRVVEPVVVAEVRALGKMPGRDRTEAAKQIKHRENREVMVATCSNVQVSVEGGGSFRGQITPKKYKKTWTMDVAHIYQNEVRDCLRIDAEDFRDGVPVHIHMGPNCSL